ncbi:transposase InsO family protein [Streptomyces sp. TE5632]
MPHRNARLTVHGRRLLVERVASGRPIAHVAAEMGISRTTAHKWVRRFAAEGDAGLHDRPSRPHTIPHRTPAPTEAEVCRLRRERKLGPARIGPVLGMPALTVHRVLTRHRLNRLAFLDRSTGQVIRRYERDRPGELVHIDVKKLGRIPDGAATRPSAARPDAPPAPAWVSITSTLPSTTTPALPAARSTPTRSSPPARRSSCAPPRSSTPTTSPASNASSPTTPGPTCKSLAWKQALVQLGATGQLTRAYRPQTNGKVERFNRTLVEEWAYVRPYTSNDERTAGHCHVGELP